MHMPLPLRKISSLIEFILSIFSIVQYYITFWLKNVFYIANGLIKMYNIDKKEIIRTFKLFYMGGSSMKKIRNILALLMVVVMLVAVMPMNVFAGEGDPPATGTGEHNITIKATNGTVTANPTSAVEGATVTLTITPKEGYKLKEIKATNGNDEVTLTKKSDTERTFTMPAADVTVNATFENDTKPDTKPGYYKVDVYSYAHGTAEVNTSYAKAGDIITVTAKPYSGYVVDSIVVRDGLGKKLTLFNEKYKNYYYDDYPYYLRSRWYRGYDYDDYIRWCDKYDHSRYDYSSFERWCNWNGYSYDYDDFRRFCDWDDIYDYGWYNRYDYSYLNQADFVMPNSAVRVEVTFTSASYWYDDYYYYRYYRNKKDNYYERQKKAEEKAKEEEEAKAKAEAEKLPQVYENKAVIAIGSNVLDKVSKNVHTVHQMDTPAYVNNGRVMLPLRYVAEALGLQVSWVPETKTVIIWDLTQRVEIPVKSNRIIVNGITYTSDVKPEIKSSRTMLPIANIARALGLIDGSDIIWDQYNKQVTLTRKVLSK